MRDDGIDLFLVPRADYEDAVAHAGDDLEVVAVDTSTTRSRRSPTTAATATTCRRWARRPAAG